MATNTFAALALQELPPITTYLGLLRSPAHQTHQQPAIRRTQNVQHARMQPTSIATPTEPWLSRTGPVPVQARYRAARTPSPTSVIAAALAMDSSTEAGGGGGRETLSNMAVRSPGDSSNFARYSATRRNRERQRYRDSSPPLTRRIAEDRIDGNGVHSSSTTGLGNSEMQPSQGSASTGSSRISQNSPVSLDDGRNPTLTSTLEALLRRDILPRAPSPPTRRRTQASHRTVNPGSPPPLSRSFSRPVRQAGSVATEAPNSIANVSQLPPRRWQDWLDAMNGTEDDRDTSGLNLGQYHTQRSTVVGSGQGLRSRSATITAAATALRERRPDVKKPVEEAIRYLSRIQDKGFHWTVEEAESLISCIYGSQIPESCYDFITDTTTLHVAPTSWLSAGSMYTGAQYPTQKKYSLSGSRRQSTAMAESADEPPGRNSNFMPQLGSSASPSPAHEALYISIPPEKDEDHWNVAVVIQEVDYTRNRICGSMRAYDVPDNLSSTGKSSINTFWEGEIIDFHKNGLETLNLKSDLKIDAQYWRKLDPFVGFSEVELAQKLTSREFLEDLTENYILMRWKGLYLSPPTELICYLWFLKLTRPH